MVLYILAGPDSHIGQSRDSSATYIHMHSSRHADLFEEFCRPPSATTASTTGTGNTAANSTQNATNTGDSAMTQLPGHFLPFEEIHLPPHLMPVNPEDEDDVVPDMHAAFGINRALGQGGHEQAGAGSNREPVWRDLGLERLVDNAPTLHPGVSAARREGKKTGILLLR